MPARKWLHACCIHQCTNVVKVLSARKCVIPRQHQSRFIDTAIYSERFPCRNLDSRNFDAHKSLTCLQVGNSFCDVITGCVSSILAGCLQSCSWAKRPLFELVESFGYVVPGSVCEKHMEDLSQFMTKTSRIQHPHDAIKIGKEVRDGGSNVGLTP